MIEAVRLQETLDVAAECTRIRGRLIIAGYHQDGIRSVNIQLWNWRGIDVINAHERDPQAYRQGMRSAIEAVAGGGSTPSLCSRIPFRSKGSPTHFALRTTAQRTSSRR